MDCQLGDSTLYYEQYGTGRPILMLHGMPLDHRHIAADMEPIFAGRTGWRRLYPDLPGMGKTRAADSVASQDQVLDLVLAFLDHLAPQERFVVAGTSYGAYLARGVVHRRGNSIDGVLLNVPSFSREATPQSLPQHRVIREDPAFLAALRPDEQDMREFIVAQSVELLDSFRDVFHPAGAIADQAFLARLEAQDSFTFDVDRLPAPFPAPALFLTGRFDNWCGYQKAYQLLEMYSRATFAVLDGAGHALAVEQKELFRALVSEWLARVESYKPISNQVVL
jgi:pimeloyl-ACP methyl ester carboxylesterase